VETRWGVMLHIYTFGIFFYRIHIEEIKMQILCKLIGHKWQYKRIWNASADWESQGSSFRYCMRCHKRQDKSKQTVFFESWLDDIPASYSSNHRYH